jgi:DNA-binding PadR family transcriptional regulator
MKPGRGPRATTTRYALLGMLSLGPGSGYDLKKRIDGSIAHFWSESYGQIYPHLARLAEQGLCERRREPGAGRPDRQVYSLTARGRQDLERWLREPPRIEPHRSELLLKVFLGAAGDPADSAAHVRRYREHQARLLRAYAAVGRRLRADHRAHPSLAYWIATLRYGERRAAALVAWCDETLRALGRRAGRSRRAARPAR